MRRKEFTTSLASGRIVLKSDTLLEICGDLDEAISVVGIAVSIESEVLVVKTLQNLQRELSKAISWLSQENTGNFPTQWVHENYVTFSSLVPPLHDFILPGGDKSSSILHVARTIIRRAERKSSKYPIKDFLNETSSLLFVLARYVAKEDILL